MVVSSCVNSRQGFRKQALQDVDTPGVHKDENLWLSLPLSAISCVDATTGHWYNCENGHPFTVGECGMPMETSRCPECGAMVGGLNRQAAAGVIYAAELERDFRALTIPQ
jgi:hypothetical protein